MARRWLERQGYAVRRNALERQRASDDEQRRGYERGQRELEDKRRRSSAQARARFEREQRRLGKDEQGQSDRARAVRERRLRRARRTLDRELEWASRVFDQLRRDLERRRRSSEERRAHTKTTLKEVESERRKSERE
jgi:hypothetical protein